MRTTPTPMLLVGTEFARCRLRPVVGRLPLLTAGISAVVAALGQPAVDALTVDQFTGAISLAATPGVLVAFAVGATVAQDARTSGTDATDRSMVGRPLALGAAQGLAVAVWLAIVAAAVAIAVVLTVLVSGLARGHSVSMVQSVGPVALGGVRFAVAAGASAAVGLAVAKLTGSASAAIGGFVVLVLIGDGTLLAINPQLAAVALPDNLLGLGSGELEGLAIRGEPASTTATRAVIGAAALTAAGIAIDSRRDLL